MEYVSQEVSYRGPRDVSAVRIDGVPSLAALNKLGISFNSSVLNDSSFGMDALQGLITTASISTPIQMLQKWLPGFVAVNTAARKIDELTGIAIVGDWCDAQIVQGVMEGTGNAVPYADYSTVPFTNFNLNFETRNVVRFESGLNVSILEEEQAAKVNANAAQMKREAASRDLEIQRNAVGFYGYNNGNNRTYGFLTDPNLSAYVTVAATGTGSSTLWADKTFLNITADIRTAIIALRNNSKDNIDPESLDITLALPTSVVDRLSTVSDYGISVRDWLRATYPRVRVVSAPELGLANGGANVFYLYAERVEDASTDDGRTFVQAVPTKFRVIGVEKKAKGYEEDYSNATAGIMCKRPYAVVRYTGI